MEDFLSCGDRLVLTLLEVTVILTNIFGCSRTIKLMLFKLGLLKFSIVRNQYHKIKLEKNFS
jgi:hypothetical protein